MFKRLLEWIKKPHGWALIPLYIFTACCIAGAVALSVTGRDTCCAFIAYIFYALAAITLGYSIYSLVTVIPNVKRNVTKKLKAHKFTANVLEDYDFKTTVLALLSFVLTIAFATMNLVSAVIYRLVWYGAISAYYFVLVLFRGGILSAEKNSAKRFADNAEEYAKSKWKIHLACGAFLILLEFAMIGAVTQMMLSERPAQSGEIMAICTAAYTFYKVIMAVFNLVKAHKSSNPVTKALRNLNFADACMSVVSLTVLMISTFDGASASAEMNYVKSTVGFAACVAVIAIAVIMIVRASKKLKSGAFANE